MGGGCGCGGLFGVVVLALIIDEDVWRSVDES